jgi:thymidylate synthase (FAD)
MTYLKKGRMMHTSATTTDNVNLIWATPNGEELLAHIARVSNPEGQLEAKNSSRLIRYLMDNAHWSPFEMVSVCMEINTTRDIGRQILRHRSFSFQEFSGRYQSYDKLYEAPYRECRLQDTKNRQNSLETEDFNLKAWWDNVQSIIQKDAYSYYELALLKGIAKEQARALLPEGLTPSRLYMSGTLRSWIHYVDIRCDQATQKEHRELAEQCKVILTEQFPNVFNLRD